MSAIDSSLLSKAQEAHGQNTVFFTAIAALAYAWFGQVDYGWWWPLVWLGTGIALALVTGLLMLPLMREAARTPKRGWIIGLGLPITLTRPLWLLALSWLSYDQIAPRLMGA